MAFTEPAAGAGHNYADKESSWGDFTVTPSINTGVVTFTLSDPKGLITTLRMLRAVIGDAINQWLATNRAQLVTNGVSVGNDPNVNTIGASMYLEGHIGDGLFGFVWNKSTKTAKTPSITTTSLTTTAITVSKPYADVI